MVGCSAHLQVLKRRLREAFVPPPKPSCAGSQSEAEAFTGTSEMPVGKTSTHEQGK